MMDNKIYEEQKQIIDSWKKLYYEKKKENEKLNNIISELEKLFNISINDLK